LPTFLAAAVPVKAWVNWNAVCAACSPITVHYLPETLFPHYQDLHGAIADLTLAPLPSSAAASQ
jgi:hypothetical protein